MVEFPEELRHVLEPALGRRQWDSHGAEMNSVWIDTDREVVVRVAPPDTELVSVEHTVRVARLLCDSAVPAARLHPLFDTAVRFQGGQATVWTYVHADATTVEAAQLAGTLRLLHSIEPPPDLPVRDIRPRIERRLRHLRASQPNRTGYWDALDGWYRRTSASFDRIRRCVVHGDVRPANVVSASCEAVLLDLDSVSSGPVAFDVWAVMVDRWAGRMSRDEYSEFCEVLGDDPDRPEVIDFVRLLHVAYTTLDEVRLEEQGDPDSERRCRRFQRWWLDDAPVEGLGGWKSPWT